MDYQCHRLNENVCLKKMFLFSNVQYNIILLVCPPHRGYISFVNTCVRSWNNDMLSYVPRGRLITENYPVFRTFFAITRLNFNIKNKTESMCVFHNFLQESKIFSNAGFKLLRKTLKYGRIRWLYIYKCRWNAFLLIFFCHNLAKI